MIQINLRLLSQVFLLPIRRKDNNMKKEQMNVALDPALKAKIRGMYKSDNCSTMTEFVQKAVEFYIGYLESQNSVNFIAPIITDMIKSTVYATEQRLARLLFKEAVETAKLANITAAFHNLDDNTLKSLHIRCVQEVSKINGILTLEDATKFQNGDE